MNALLQHPRVREVLISLAILAAAYVAARLLSAALGWLLRRAVQRSASTLDDRLLAALGQPVTYALFLTGAYLAIHRLPLHDRYLDRLDAVLFVLGVFLSAVALLRGFTILLAWFTRESRFANGGPAAEFGPLFNKTGRVVIILLAVITLLQHFGVNVASLVVSLGVGSLAVGLAAQDTLANMFAGFTLMLDRPFRLGDRIQLATGELGDVEAIGIRATRIRTVDETTLVVPNSLLVKERLVNLASPTRHITVRLEVGVAYGTDLATAKAILAEAALAAPQVERERAPVVLVTRFGDSAVQLLLIFWARDYLERGLALSAVHEEVYRRFVEAGIEIPFPVRRMIHEGAEPALRQASEG